MESKQRILQCIEEQITFINAHSKIECDAYFCNAGRFLGELNPVEWYGRASSDKSNIKVIPENESLTYFVDLMSAGKWPKKDRLDRLKYIRRKVKEFVPPTGTLSLLPEEQTEILGYLENKYRFSSFLKERNITVDILNLNYGSSQKNTFLYHLANNHYIIGSLGRGKTSPCRQATGVVHELGHILQTAHSGKLRDVPVSYSSLIGILGIDPDAALLNGRAASETFATYFSLCSLRESRWEEPVAANVPERFVSVFDKYFQVLTGAFSLDSEAYPL